MPWHPAGISPQSLRSHLVYVDRLCRDFQDLVLRNLDAFFREQEEQVDGRVSEETALLLREVEQHVAFCHNR